MEYIFAKYQFNVKNLIFFKPLNNKFKMNFLKAQKYTETVKII